MTNSMEWQPIETAKRFTLVFEGDIRKIDGFIGHVDTPFGRPVASGLGNAFDQCAASEARISELEAEVERLKEDVSRQMAIANSECEEAERSESHANEVILSLRNKLGAAERDRDKWIRQCETEEAAAKIARNAVEALTYECDGRYFISYSAGPDVTAHVSAIRARSTAMKGGEL